MPWHRPSVCRQSLATLAPPRSVAMLSHATAIDFGTCKCIELLTRNIFCIILRKVKKSVSLCITKHLWFFPRLAAIASAQLYPLESHATICIFPSNTARMCIHPTIQRRCTQPVKLMFNYSLDPMYRYRNNVLTSLKLAGITEPIVKKLCSNCFA